MKKILFLFVLGMALSSYARAAVNPPRDQQGRSVPSVDFVGVDSVVIDAAQSTTPLLVLSGRGCVYGVIASSIAASDFIVLRDTNTANVTSATTTVVYAGSSGQATTTSGANATLTIKFPVPIKFSNGISVNASAAPSGGGRAMWTILYRRLNATE